MSDIYRNVIDGPRPDRERERARYERRRERPDETKLVRLTVEVPRYVKKELQFMAFDDEVSLRYLVLVILKDAGVSVKEEDLIKDGRKER
jgi:hypothetical protein